MAQAREHTESTGSQYAWRRQLLRELTGHAVRSIGRFASGCLSG